MTPSDLRSVSDRMLKLYLYSLGAWAICLLALFTMDRIGVALSFCFPLSIWLGALTVFWWVTTRRKQKARELELIEVKAGVQTIGRILAGGGVIPGMIFLANDPLIPAAWGTLVGAAITSGAAWQLVHLSIRIKRARFDPIILIIAWAILPINATGAVSLGALLGWFEQVTHITGMPMP